MDKNFFGEQISRLRANYSPGAMNDERIQVMWDRFKNVENRVFRNAVDYLISEYTTQTLPALSKFAEAVGMFRTNVGAQMQEMLPAFECEPCRDFGFGWDEHVIVRCHTCERGRTISPAELAKQQGFYDKGRGIGAGSKLTLPPLPYDPTKPVSSQPFPRNPELTKLGEQFGAAIDRGEHLTEEEKKKRGIATQGESA